MLWKDVTQNDSIPPNVCTVEALWVQQKVKWGWCKSLWPLCCTAASSHTRRTRSLHTCSSLCLWRPLVVDCGIGREQTASAGSSTSCCSVLPSFLLLLLLIGCDYHHSCWPVALLDQLGYCLRLVCNVLAAQCVCLRVMSDVICWNIAHPNWPNCEANEKVEFGTHSILVEMIIIICWSMRQFKARRQIFPLLLFNYSYTNLFSHS